MTPPNRPESAQREMTLDEYLARLPESHTVRRQLRLLRSRLSLLEAQNAELLASREAWQLEAIDGREVLKHHADRARAAESALEAAKADTERLRAALRRVAEEEWDDIRPGHGLHLRNVRDFAAGAVAHQR